MSTTRTLTSRRGFTIMEMMMVLAMVGITVSLAAPSFSRMIAKNKVKATSSNLQITFFKARSEAVKRNANVSITATTGTNWASGWSVVDANGNELYNMEAPAATVSPNPNGNDIIYLGSGRIQGNTPRSFTVQHNHTGLNDADNRCVKINLTGMPSIIEGAC